MPEKTRAIADIHGHAVKILLNKTIEGPAFLSDDRYNIKVVRRQDAYPIDPIDGQMVADIPHLLENIGDDTPRIERILCFLPHFPKEDVPVEIIQAGVEMYYPTSSSQHPSKVRIVIFGTEMVEEEIIENISRVEYGPKRVDDHCLEETIFIYQAYDSSETLAAQIQIITDYSDQSEEITSWFKWFKNDSDTIPFLTQGWSAKANVKVIFGQHSGDVDIDVAITDVGLTSDAAFYYSIFSYDNNGKLIKSRHPIHISATPTGHFQLDQRLYQMLPAFYQQQDEPSNNLRGKGQLRRFLQCFGLGFDQLRSLAETLRCRHDVRKVHADCLPHLAHFIGWKLDCTADELAQRTEIFFAPEIYKSVGTLPNIKVLVNHVTGWDSRVKEYADNILSSNAPETIQLWEIYQQNLSDNENALAEPVSLQNPLSDQFDGRPVPVMIDELLHLYYHTRQDNVWQIWYRKQINGSWSDPQCIIPDPDENAHGLLLSAGDPAAVVDLDGKIWLFFSGLCEGRWNIWQCSPAGEITRITQTPSIDAKPAAVMDQDGDMRLFWHSNRRGPNDIWSVLKDENGWSLLRRLTTGMACDAMPAACVDNQKRIWLFWNSTQNGQSHIFGQIYKINDKKELVPLLRAPQAVTKGDHRHQSPKAIVRTDRGGQKIWLFWHANQDGSWQIWRQELSYTAENSITPIDAPIQLTKGRTGNKEPAVVVGPSNQLSLFWRSQRRGWIYQSRSFHKDDTSKLDTFEDRLHYTPESGKDKDHRYTPDTIGIYITPDIKDAVLAEKDRNIVSNVLKRFLPARVRVLPVIEPALCRETVFSKGFPKDSFKDNIITQIMPISTYTKLTIDNYLDTIDGWVWAHSWSHTHNQTDVSNNPTFRTWHVGVALAS